MGFMGGAQDGFGFWKVLGLGVLGSCCDVHFCLCQLRAQAGLALRLLTQTCWMLDARFVALFVLKIAVNYLSQSTCLGRCLAPFDTDFSGQGHTRNCHTVVGRCCM